ncbi:hypothetical protein [Streptomyces sp. NPDC046860]|uniref:hypothetical protein n=1 Tax=Streptomyces sp. NPDC046860 TaxID=3154495 RepID=UPI0033CA2488
MAQLNVLTTVIDAASAAQAADRPLAPEIPEAVRRMADATTAARVRVSRGAPPPSRTEVRHLAREGYTLAAAPATHPAGPNPAHGVLEPSRQEVAAARGISAPR